MLDRKSLNKALSTACAYAEVNKPDKADEHARKLVDLMFQQGLLKLNSTYRKAS